MEHITIEVCQDCIHYIAYGELRFDTTYDQDYEFMQRIKENWPPSQYNLIADGESLGFSSSSCECCGDKLHGERYSAVALQGG